MTVIFLTPRHDIGISRNQGVLRFDGKSIVLEPIKREGFPTYLNGVLVDTPHNPRARDRPGRPVLLHLVYPCLVGSPILAQVDLSRARALTPLARSAA